MKQKKIGLYLCNSSLKVYWDFFMECILNFCCVPQDAFFFPTMASWEHGRLLQLKESEAIVCDILAMDGCCCCCHHCCRRAGVRCFSLGGGDFHILYIKNKVILKVTSDEFYNMGFVILVYREFLWRNEWRAVRQAAPQWPHPSHTCKPPTQHPL